MQEENDNILDELAADLQNNPPKYGRSTQITVGNTKDISNIDDLETYVNENSQKSNDIMLQVLQNFAKDIGDDAERAEAFAKLVKSNTDLLKILNTRLIKEKEFINKINIEKIRTEKETVNKLIEQQNSIVMSREEMFKELLKDAQDAEVVDEKST
jgi:hypothetical protein